MPGYYRKRTSYNPRYGAYVGKTTRSTPGVYRRPAGPRVFRRRFSRYGNRETLKRTMLSISEKKYHDTTTNGDLSVSLIGRVHDLSQVVQGSTDNARVGDKLVVNSLEFNYHLYCGTAAIDNVYNDMGMRILVFIWKDDTVPLVSDIIQVAPGAPPEYYYMAPLNHDTKVKRKILYDKSYVRANGIWNGSSGTYGQGLAQVGRRVFINLKKYPVSMRTINYESGGVTGVNKIYCIAISDVTPGLSQQPFYGIYNRLNFVDP